MRLLELLGIIRAPFLMPQRATRQEHLFLLIQQFCLIRECGFWSGRESVGFGYIQPKS